MNRIRQDEGDLPVKEKGTRLSNEVPCPSCWPFLVVGLIMGGIFGAGFASILRKDEISK